MMTSTRYGINVTSLDIVLEKVCCAALSIAFHIIYYSMWLLEIFFTRLTLTVGANNEGESQMLAKLGIHVTQYLVHCCDI